MSFSASFSGPFGASVSAASVEEAGRRCGLHFNPAGNPAIDAVKGFAAAAMQAVINTRTAEQARFAALDNPDRAERDRHNDAMRCFATALTQIESGQMFAVKGIAAVLGD